ncbi:TPA: DUF2806 domain-containing protein [Salmonella enterica]
MSISKLAEKLWETVGVKGFSALCKPGQIRREGIASIEMERKKMLILAQTEMEIEEIKSGKAIVSLNDFNNPKLISLEGPEQYDNSGKMEPYINIENLTKEVSTQLIAREIQKEVNIAKSILIAENVLLSDQTQPKDENVEEDWLLRWRDSAAMSSSEKLQQLWGSILAGEIKSPGTYSLRTIEFIKNLTQKEASNIQKLFSYILFGRIIKGEALSDNFDNEHIDKELTFNFLSNMQALGVIAGAESMGLSTKFKSNSKESFKLHCIYNEKVMHVVHDDPNKLLEFNVLILTPLGQELNSLCTSIIDSTYLNYVISVIKKQGFKVIIGDIVKHSDGKMTSINNVEV